MATSTTTTQPPALIGPDDARWGPGPDAFPAGLELCLLHGAPDAPGAMFTIRLRAGQGYVFAPHLHPHDEHITVVSGTLLLGNGAKLDRQTARRLGAGGYAFLPKEQFHYAWTEGETVFQVSAIGPFGITYANPEDDPRAASQARGPR